jgi:transposase-like protein
MTVWVAVKCPHCHSTNVVKNGFSGEGKQRYLCRNKECERRSFIRNYSYNGCRKEVKKKIPRMVVNGSGIKDIARVLEISEKTVASELKKNDH